MARVSLDVRGMGYWAGQRARGRSEHTQLFLKQSWEQKKLPLMLSLMHVGHWSASASFWQPAPRHFRGAEVMLGDNGRVRCEVFSISLFENGCVCLETS